MVHDLTAHIQRATAEKSGYEVVWLKNMAVDLASENPSTPFASRVTNHNPHYAPDRHCQTHETGS